MSWAVWGGGVLVAFGLAGLGACVWKANRVRRGAVSPEDEARVLRSLVAWNAASVGLAFLGLAGMLVGLVL